MSTGALDISRPPVENGYKSSMDIQVQHANGTAACEVMLLNKSTCLSSVQMVWFGENESFMYPIDKELSMTGKLPFERVKQKFPQPIFESLPAFSGVSTVRCDRYWFSYSEIRGVGDRRIEIQKTAEYLYLKDWVGVIHVSDKLKIYAIPTSSLSRDLGITNENYPRLLHGLFVTKAPSGIGSTATKDAAKPIPVAPPDPEEENLAGLEPSTSSSSIAGTLTRKKRKVSFAPYPPTSQGDALNQVTSSGSPSTNRRSTRLSRLKDEPEDVALISLAQEKSPEDSKISLSDIPDLDIRVTRSKLVSMNSSQETGASDEESVSSTVSSITSSCSHSPRSGDVSGVRRRSVGRPPGSKNKRTLQKIAKLELTQSMGRELESYDSESMAIAKEFLSKYPMEVQGGIKRRRRRRRRPAEVKEATAREVNVVLYDTLEVACHIVTKVDLGRKTAAEETTLPEHSTENKQDIEVIEMEDDFAQSTADTPPVSAEEGIALSQIPPSESFAVDAELTKGSFEGVGASNGDIQPPSNEVHLTDNELLTQHIFLDPEIEVEEISQSAEMGLEQFVVVDKGGQYIPQPKRMTLADYKRRRSTVDDAAKQAVSATTSIVVQSKEEQKSDDTPSSMEISDDKQEEQLIETSDNKQEQKLQSASDGDNTTLSSLEKLQTEYQDQASPESTPTLNAGSSVVVPEDKEIQVLVKDEVSGINQEQSLSLKDVCATNLSSEDVKDRIDDAETKAAIKTCVLAQSFQKQVSNQPVSPPTIIEGSKPASDVLIPPELKSESMEMVGEMVSKDAAEVVPLDIPEGMETELLENASEVPLSSFESGQIGISADEMIMGSTGDSAVVRVASIPEDKDPSVEASEISDITKDMEPGPSYDHTDISNATAEELDVDIDKKGLAVGSDDIDTEREDKDNQPEDSISQHNRETCLSGSVSQMSEGGEDNTVKQCSTNEETDKDNLQPTRVQEDELVTENLSLQFPEDDKVQERQHKEEDLPIVSQVSAEVKNVSSVSNVEVISDPVAAGSVFNIPIRQRVPLTFPHPVFHSSVHRTLLQTPVRPPWVLPPPPPVVPGAVFGSPDPSPGPGVFNAPTPSPLPGQHGPWGNFSGVFPNLIQSAQQHFMDPSVIDIHRQQVAKTPESSRTPSPCRSPVSPGFRPSRSQSRSRALSSRSSSQSSSRSSRSRRSWDRDSIQKKELISRILLEELEALGNAVTRQDMGTQVTPKTKNFKGQRGSSYKLVNHSTQTPRRPKLCDIGLQVVSTPKRCNKGMQMDGPRRRNAYTLTSQVHTSEATSQTSEEELFDDQKSLEDLRSMLLDSKWSRVRSIMENFLDQIDVRDSESDEESNSESCERSSSSSDDSVCDDNAKDGFVPSPVISGASNISEGDLSDITPVGSESGTPPPQVLAMEAPGMHQGNSGDGVREESDGVCSTTLQSDTVSTTEGPSSAWSWPCSALTVSSAETISSSNELPPQDSQKIKEKASDSSPGLSNSLIKTSASKTPDQDSSALPVSNPIGQAHFLSKGFPTHPHPKSHLPLPPPPPPPPPLPAYLSKLYARRPQHLLFKAPHSSSKTSILISPQDQPKSVPSSKSGTTPTSVEFIPSPTQKKMTLSLPSSQYQKEVSIKETTTSTQGSSSVPVHAPLSPSHVPLSIPDSLGTRPPHAFSVEGSATHDNTSTSTETNTLTAVKSGKSKSPLEAETVLKDTSDSDSLEAVGGLSLLCSSSAFTNMDLHRNKSQASPKSPLLENTKERMSREEHSSGESSDTMGNWDQISKAIPNSISVEKDEKMVASEAGRGMTQRGSAQREKRSLGERRRAATMDDSPTRHWDRRSSGSWNCRRKLDSSPVASNTDESRSRSRHRTQSSSRKRKRDWSYSRRRIYHSRSPSRERNRSTSQGRYRSDSREKNHHFFSRERFHSTSRGRFRSTSRDRYFSSSGRNYYSSRQKFRSTSRERFCPRRGRYRNERCRSSSSESCSSMTNTSIRERRAMRRKILSNSQSSFAKTKLLGKPAIPIVFSKGNKCPSSSSKTKQLSPTPMVKKPTLTAAELLAKKREKMKLKESSVESTSNIKERPADSETTSQAGTNSSTPESPLDIDELMEKFKIHMAKHSSKSPSPHIPETYQQSLPHSSENTARAPLSIKPSLPVVSHMSNVSSSITTVTSCTTITALDHEEFLQSGLQTLPKCQPIEVSKSHVKSKPIEEMSTTADQESRLSDVRCGLDSKVPASFTYGTSSFKRDILTEAKTDVTLKQSSKLLAEPKSLLTSESNTVEENVCAQSESTETSCKGKGLYSAYSHGKIEDSQSSSDNTGSIGTCADDIMKEPSQIDITQCPSFIPLHSNWGDDKGDSLTEMSEVDVDGVSPNCVKDHTFKPNILEPLVSVDLPKSPLMDDETTSTPSSSPLFIADKNHSPLELSLVVDSPFSSEMHSSGHQLKEIEEWPCGKVKSPHEKEDLVLQNKDVQSGRTADTERDKNYSDKKAFVADDSDVHSTETSISFTPKLKSQVQCVVGPSIAKHASIAEPAQQNSKLQPERIWRAIITDCNTGKKQGICKTGELSCNMECESKGVAEQFHSEKPIVTSTSITPVSEAFIVDASKTLCTISVDNCSSTGCISDPSGLPVIVNASLEHEGNVRLPSSHSSLISLKSGLKKRKSLEDVLKKLTGDNLMHEKNPLNLSSASNICTCSTSTISISRKKGPKFNLLSKIPKRLSPVQQKRASYIVSIPVMGPKRRPRGSSCDTNQTQIQVLPVLKRLRAHSLVKHSDVGMSHTEDCSSLVVSISLRNIVLSNRISAVSEITSGSADTSVSCPSHSNELTAVSSEIQSKLEGILIAKFMMKVSDNLAAFDRLSPSSDTQTGATKSYAVCESPPNERYVKSKPVLPSLSSSMKPTNASSTSPATSPTIPFPPLSSVDSIQKNLVQTASCDETHLSVSSNEITAKGKSTHLPKLKTETFPLSGIVPLSEIEPPLSVECVDGSKTPHGSVQESDLRRRVSFMWTNTAIQCFGGQKLQLKDSEAYRRGETQFSVESNLPSDLLSPGGVIDAAKSYRDQSYISSESFAALNSQSNSKEEKSIPDSHSPSQSGSRNKEVTIGYDCTKNQSTCYTPSSGAVNRTSNSPRSPSSINEDSGIGTADSCSPEDTSKRSAYGEMKKLQSKKKPLLANSNASDTTPQKNISIRLSSEDAWTKSISNVVQEDKVSDDQMSFKHSKSLSSLKGTSQNEPQSPSAPPRSLKLSATNIKVMLQNSMEMPEVGKSASTALSSGSTVQCHNTSMIMPTSDTSGMPSETVSSKKSSGGFEKTPTQTSDSSIQVKGPSGGPVQTPPTQTSPSPSLKNLSGATTNLSPTNQSSAELTKSHITSSSVASINSISGTTMKKPLDTSTKLSTGTLPNDICDTPTSTSVTSSKSFSSTPEKSQQAELSKTIPGTPMKTPTGNTMKSPSRKLTITQPTNRVSAGNTSSTPSNANVTSISGSTPTRSAPSTARHDSAPSKSTLKGSPKVSSELNKSAANLPSSTSDGRDAFIRNLFNLPTCSTDKDAECVKSSHDGSVSTTGVESECTESPGKTGTTVSAKRPDVQTQTPPKTPDDKYKFSPPSGSIPAQKVGASIPAITSRPFSQNVTSQQHMAQLPFAKESPKKRFVWGDDIKPRNTTSPHSTYRNRMASVNYQQPFPYVSPPYYQRDVRNLYLRNTIGNSHDYNHGSRHPDIPGHRYGQRLLSANQEAFGERVRNLHSHISNNSQGPLLSPPPPPYLYRFWHNRY